MRGAMAWWAQDGTTALIQVVASAADRRILSLTSLERSPKKDRENMTHEEVSPYIFHLLRKDASSWHLIRANLEKPCHYLPMNDAEMCGSQHARGHEATRDAMAAMEMSPPKEFHAFHAFNAPEELYDMPIEERRAAIKTLGAERVFVAQTVLFFLGGLAAPESSPFRSFQLQLCGDSDFRSEEVDQNHRPRGFPSEVFDFTGAAQLETH